MESCLCVTSENPRFSPEFSCMQKMLVVNKHFRLLEFMCHILFRLRFINAAGERRAKAMDNERQFWGTEFPFPAN